MLRSIRRPGAALAASIVAVTLLTGGCTTDQSITTGASPYTVGSGRLATQSRTLAPFHELEANGAVRVQARVDTSGAAPRVEVRTDDNLLSMVRTQVSEGRLTIWIDGSLTTKLGIDLVVSAPALDMLIGNASAVIRAEGIVAPNVLVAATSAADVSATGSVDLLDLQVLAGAKAGLFDLAAKEIDVEVSGAARAEVRASGAVRGTVTSGAVLWIDGEPATIAVTTSAAGQVKRR